METLVFVALTLMVLSVGLLFAVLRRVSKTGVTPNLELQFTTLNKSIERVERAIREELVRNREEAGTHAKDSRKEMSAALTEFAGSFRGQMRDIATLQKDQLDSFARQLASLTESTERKLEGMRETLEGRLRTLQEENGKKLELMRATVDEKLHATLEQRLGESFKLVSERLELVHKGLGEMHLLASGVGDLKKVLTNVKTRGTWGEIQLGNLLDQILTSEQYAKNVATKVGSADRVEFAIKLPGRDREDGNPVWLPIDAKFPQEVYQKLVEAQEQASPLLAESAGKDLEVRIKGEAKAIKEKYLDPPKTTDFGIMFLPTEGLYAEVTRRIGLCEVLQREYRVTIMGPNTLAAFLNSLQMGFRTIAIERRSSEVWSLLGAVKTEFGRFGEVLEKTKKKLEEASNTIDTAAAKSRTIERRLREVQELPSQEALNLLGPAEDIEERDDDLFSRNDGQ